VISWIAFAALNQLIRLFGPRWLSFRLGVRIIADKNSPKVAKAQNFCLSSRSNSGDFRPAHNHHPD